MEEAVESHVKSTLTEKVPHPGAGEKRPKVMKPSAVKMDALQEPSSMGDGIHSATVRAWAGAGLVGLLVAWVTISATR